MTVEPSAALFDPADEFLRALTALRVWRRAAEAARHKPLLVLLALARVRDGLPRLMAFTEIEAPLRHLLAVDAPGRRGHPEYPFWRLQADGIWEVLGADRLRRRQSNTDIPVKVLREQRVQGGFLPEFHLALQADHLLVAEAAQIMLQQLPARSRPRVLEALGWTVEAVGRHAPVVDRPYSPVDHHRMPRPSLPAQPDPDLYGRGLSAHRATQTRLAAFLAEHGIEPRSPGTEASFDILWRHRGLTYVAEVKSITDENEEQQLRMGLGQVLRYRQALIRADERPIAVLVVERKPTDDSWVELCADVDVVLSWPDLFQELLIEPAPPLGR